MRILRVTSGSIVMLKSNCAEDCSISKGIQDKSSRLMLPTAVLWKLNSTWTSGDRLGSRPDCNSLTKVSNGASLFVNASSTTWRTRLSTWRKVGLPEIFVRSTRILINVPTTRSHSRRLRFAIGDPTAISSWPVYLHKSTLKAAKKSIYNDAFSSTACLLSASMRGLESSIVW